MRLKRNAILFSRNGEKRAWPNTGSRITVESQQQAALADAVLKRLGISEVRRVRLLGPVSQ
jgi:hypothetical protein